MSDTGIGIPEEKRHAIFEAFNQADTSTTRRYGGTGLGLTISKQLVEMMGGRMWVESVVGEGSTFHFVVRFGVQENVPALQDSTVSPLDLRGSSARVGANSIGHSSLRILLAEDNAVNQKFAVRLLEKQGHQVFVTNNGWEAVEAFEREHGRDGRFDLILMDIQMPVMGGLEATAEIRKREQANGGHIPIIAMTAHAMKGDRELCLEAGMDDYVSKPVQQVELFQAIDRVMAATDVFPSGDDPSKPQEPPFDYEKALDHVGGDEALLAEIAAVFIEEYPGLTSAVQAAVESRDSDALARAAHTLKGSVSNFCAQKAFDAVLRLEKMGKSGDLSAVDEAWATLQVEVERVKDALMALTSLV